MGARELARCGMLDGMPLVHVGGPPLSAEPRPGLVRLLCGVAGAGKTTYAQHLESCGFTRLSIDDEIWDRFGRFGLDYPPEEYERRSASAVESLEAELARLLSSRTPIVLDRSLWARSARDRCKELVTRHGGTWELVHLDVDRTTLRERLRRRAERFDAHAAFPISAGRLDAFLAGFEAPDGEGETVLRWV